MTYRDGRRFFITLWRPASFPVRFSSLAKVECRFVNANGAVSVWAMDASCYMLNGTSQNATFGFMAQGHGTGQLVITVDDDIIGPITVDETSIDPCATPGPVGTKAIGTRDQ